MWNNGFLDGQCLIHSDIAILTSDLGVRLKMRKAFKVGFVN